MKKLLSLLAVALFALPMLAASITISFANHKTDFASFTDQGITVAVAKGTATTDPTVNTTSNDLRLYAGSNITISCADTISGMTFTFSSKGVARQATVTASAGAMSQTSGASSASWSGAAKSVTLTVGAMADFGTDGNTKAGQVRHYRVRGIHQWRYRFRRHHTRPR